MERILELTGNVHSNGVPLKKGAPGDICFHLREDCNHQNLNNSFVHLETFILNNEGKWVKVLIRAIIGHSYFYELPAKITEELTEKVSVTIEGILKEHKGMSVMWDGRIYKN